MIQFVILMRFLILKNILLFLLLSNYLFAKVDPPNYDFSLDTLKDFFPNATVDEIKKKYGDGEILETKGNIILLRYYVAQIRYKFPVFIQVSDNKVLDLYAKLPSYFSHDIFHQSLINRFGAHDKYFKHENNAIYIWNDKNGNRHLYEGACSITCFPIYYTITTNTPSTSGFIPFVDRLKTKQIKLELF